jgi:hypothetical protein
VVWKSLSSSVSAVRGRGAASVVGVASISFTVPPVRARSGFSSL